MLAKLSNSLHEACNRSRTRREPNPLIGWGWRDFRVESEGRGRGEDAVHLAADAFVVLSFETGGAWRKATCVLQGVLAYLREEGFGTPSPEALRSLLALLQANPVDVEAVKAWFAGQFLPR